MRNWIIALLLLLISLPAFACETCEPSPTPVVILKPFGVVRHKHSGNAVAATVGGLAGLGLGLGISFNMDKPHNVEAEKQESQVQFGAHVYQQDGD